MTLNVQFLAATYDQFRTHAEGAFAFNVRRGIGSKNHSAIVAALDKIMEMPNIKLSSLEGCDFCIHSRDYPELDEFLTMSSKVCTEWANLIKEQLILTNVPECYIPITICTEYSNRDNSISEIVELYHAVVIVPTQRVIEVEKINISKMHRFFLKFALRDFKYAWANNLTYNMYIRARVISIVVLDTVWINETAGLSE